MGETEKEAVWKRENKTEREAGLLVKSPLRYKTPKNNGFFRGRRTHTDKISLLKAFLHKCGRAAISSKQLKKIKQDKRMYATFPESQKNT